MKKKGFYALLVTLALVALSAGCDTTADRSVRNQINVTSGAGNANH